MLKKKISLLIIGLKNEYSLENFYKKAFNSIGIKKVFCFPNNINFYLYCLLGSLKLKFLFVPINYIYQCRLNIFLKKRKPFDFIIIFKGIEINKKYLIELKNNNPKTRIINIFTDDPFNLNSVATSSNSLLSSIPIYDYFFIWSQKIKSKLQKKYKSYKNFYYLPFGFNNKINKINKNKIDLNYISLIASGDHYRESIVKKINRIRLNIFGNSWGKNIENHSVKNFVYGKKLIEIIAKSFVSINILRKQNESSHNMKTFEIPAMGGLLFTTRSQEQNFFFPENKASIMFGSIREFEKKILFLMNNKKIAERIRQKGFELSRKHSYNNRAKYLLKLINNNNAR
jgi:spore maturation protein CgeB